MKRCPECDFLYEDEQDRCDMDGTTLNFTATLPPLPLPQPVVPHLKSIWSGFTIPLLVLVLLGTVLIILYRAAPSSSHSSAGVKKQEAVNQDTRRPAASELVTVPAMSPEPVELSTGTPTKATRSNRPLSSTSANEPAVAPASHIQIEPATPTVSAPKPAISQSSPKAASPVSEKPPASSYIISAHPKPSPGIPASQPATQAQEKDSKLKSFFKKAGRVLKKPF